MLHVGNDSNKFKLLGDKGAPVVPGLRRPGDGQKAGDSKNWDDFIARMQRGRITKEHWDYAQFVWSTYAKVLPEAQKTHKGTHGREFETVELRVVQTPFGEYRGGVPATTDRDEVSSPRPAESIEGIAGMEQNFEWSVSTGGFTIERNPNYAQPLILNAARQLVGIDAELRFIHLQPTIRDVLRLSRERQFADAFGLRPGRNQRHHHALALRTPRRRPRAGRAISRWWTRWQRCCAGARASRRWA